MANSRGFRIPARQKMFGVSVASVRSYMRRESSDADAQWLGIAPSYLCTQFGLSYDEACMILLALQAEGFIYDNDHGGDRTLEDGRICATRFYLVGWHPAKA